MERGDQRGMRGSPFLRLMGLPFWTLSSGAESSNKDSIERGREEGKRKRRKGQEKQKDQQKM